MSSRPPPPSFEAIFAVAVVLVFGDILQVEGVTAGRGQLIDWRAVKSGHVLLEEAGPYEIAHMLVALVGSDAVLQAVAGHSKSA